MALVVLKLLKWSKMYLLKMFTDISSNSFPFVFHYPISV